MSMASPNQIVCQLVFIDLNHYISIITNLTSLKIDDFAKEINPDRVMSILASTHIKELERNKLMDRFISNFLICEKRGFNISAVEIAYPPYITEIQKYKDFFRKKGITLQFDPFKGNNKGKEYPESYTEEEIKAFGITLRPDSYTTMVHKGCICNAGYNAGIVTPAGDIQICFESKKTIGNVYNRIEFRKTLITCPFEYCQCPLKYYDPYLFQKAMADFRNPV